MSKEYTESGMMYTWELAGPHGAAFILFPDYTDTKLDVDRAKRELRNSRDVTSIKTANDVDRDSEYKFEYFRDPRMRDLRWYQINQDEKLIRKERLAGTSPKDFVTNHVLPFTSRTEQEFLKKSGDSIYLM